MAHEEDISAEQARSADEAFITSTSFCICPVRSYDGVRLDKTGIPGPITRQLSDAFAKEAQFDFVGQYLDALAEVDYRPLWQPFGNHPVFDRIQAETENTVSPVQPADRLKFTER